MQHMNLIYLYGPPASGKLTIAKELEKITKYKILHNHLTVDLLTNFFEFDSVPFRNLNSKFRLDILKETAKDNFKGIITTVCYARGDRDDDKNIRKFIKELSSLGVKMCFVQIVCSINEMEKRVTASSRKKYGKLDNVKNLRKCMKKWVLDEPIPYVESLRIDSTSNSAKDVAKQIKKHFKL
jgi:tRNA uridine 5-carbamoylmethylation protein Kti12